MIGVRVVNILWAILIFCGSLSGAQQTQDSRLVKAIYARIQAAKVMPDVLAEVTAQYADDFWPLKIKKTITTNRSVHRLHVVGQRGLLAVFGREITAFDLKTGAMREIPNNHKCLITAIAHNGRLDVVTGDHKGKICFWSIKKDSQYYQLFAHEGPVKSLAFLDDDTCMSVGDESMLIWNWQPPKSPSEDNECISLENSARVLPIDHCSVAVAMDNGTINIMDVKKGVVNKTISTQRYEPMEALARLPHNKIISAYRFSEAVCVRDMEGNGYHRIDGAIGCVTHLIPLEDEVVCVRLESPAISRVKHWASCGNVGINSLRIGKNDINEVVGSCAGNFFVVADDARDLHIVQRVGDDVPEEKIDHEFVEWMNERPAATAVEPAPIVVRKPRKKKHDWCACS